MLLNMLEISSILNTVQREHKFVAHKLRSRNGKPAHIVHKTNLQMIRQHNFKYTRCVSKNFNTKELKKKPQLFVNYTNFDFERNKQKP